MPRKAYYSPAPIAGSGFPMTTSSPHTHGLAAEPHPLTDTYYRESRRRHVYRLLLTYILPIVLLTLYFLYQYRTIVQQGGRLHLQAIAENQANTLDLFLSERLVNLSNVINDPRFELPPGNESMDSYLAKLRLNSETFVDLGFFNADGIQTAYAGPFQSLEQRNYSSESWWRALQQPRTNFIITNIYLGFRQQPHFTIATKRDFNGRNGVLRATLEPRKIYEYMTSLKGAGEVFTSIINDEGLYQVVTPEIGTPLSQSHFIPPRDVELGVGDVPMRGESVPCGYAWLKNAEWAVIVLPQNANFAGFSGHFLFTFFSVSALAALLILIIIFNRATKLVELQREADRTRAQLAHAAKLASVGELAAGIAHEINNPLAVINEQAGLVKDLMDPSFGTPTAPEELTGHLDSIQSAVFRCRDITRKLLGFVRQTDLDLKYQNANDLIDDVVDGLLGREIVVSNIEVVKDYDPTLTPLLTDANQLEQVILNIINNGVDALEGQPGRISIATWKEDNHIKIAIRDTGKGMTEDQLENIFVPFYTTKDVGKGTGLGLSVSYGIIKSLGGTIEVESRPGKGTTFTITLPIRTAGEK